MLRHSIIIIIIIFHSYIKCFTNLDKEICHFGVSIVFISMFCINQL